MNITSDAETIKAIAASILRDILDAGDYDQPDIREYANMFGFIMTNELFRAVEYDVINRLAIIHTLLIP